MNSKNILFYILLEQKTPSMKGTKTDEESAEELFDGNINL